MLMMMGSADALPTAPTVKTKFIEDMSEQEAAAAVSCYVSHINSTLLLVELKERER